MNIHYETMEDIKDTYIWPTTKECDAREAHPMYGKIDFCALEDLVMRGMAPARAMKSLGISRNWVSAEQMQAFVDTYYHIHTFGEELLSKTRIIQLHKMFTGEDSAFNRGHLHWKNRGR